MTSVISGQVPQPDFYQNWEDWAAQLITMLQEATAVENQTETEGGTTDLSAYYTAVQVDTLLANKAPVGHNHDDLYYTEVEVDNKFATLTYTHSQGSPATTWTINHNLGFKPDISLLTAGGVEFDAEITHVNNNQAVVNLNVATAGTARCS